MQENINKLKQVAREMGYTEEVIMRFDTLSENELLECLRSYFAFCKVLGSYK